MMPGRRSDSAAGHETALKFCEIFELRIHAKAMTFATANLGVCLHTLSACTRVAAAGPASSFPVKCGGSHLAGSLTWP